MESRLRGRVRPQAFWGPWVPTSGCLKQRGSKTSSKGQRHKDLCGSLVNGFKGSNIAGVIRVA